MYDMFDMLERVNTTLCSKWSGENDKVLLAEFRNCIVKFGYYRDYVACCLSIVWSVTRVYCDKMTKAKITQFTVKVANCLDF